MFTCVTHGHLLYFRMSSTYLAKERYGFGGLSNSFMGFGKDKCRRIRGSAYSPDNLDVFVRMPVRLHHVQMKCSLHILRNFWYKRIRRGLETCTDYPIPAEIRIALSWLIGQDVLTRSDMEIIDLLCRAFRLDKIEGVYMRYRCEAPFCITDFVSKTSFCEPPLRNPPPTPEECVLLGDLPYEFLSESGRKHFRSVQFRRRP